jgi:uncharacterized SAM-binding protein YcdF (DUF218 family)
MPTILGTVAKQFVPGSLAFLILGLVAALLVLLLEPRWKRWTVLGLLLLSGFYTVLSLPALANRLADGLDRYPPLTQADEARGASAVVLLHGDHPAARLRETLRLYKLLNPKWIVVSAQGPHLRDSLRYSAPPDQILWESRSRTTREQALNLATLLQAKHIARVVLVASPIHMLRALGACRTAGIDVVPAVSPRPHASMPRGMRGLVPQIGALTLSTESLYEYLALYLYKHRGWA